MVESEFKLATEADKKTLKELIQQFYELEDIPFHPNEIEQNLSILLKDQSLGSAWLFVHEHRIIGYTILIYSFDLELGGRCALVTDLYLEPAQRRKGHGRRMLQHLEEFCRKSGFHALELAVERRNAGALAFYKECGFQTHDLILMSKRILPR